MAIESDPRVLIIDNYGIYFEVGMENTFRNQLITMNRRLGTTILLASPNEAHLKKFCSVLVYLDNGYISGVRSGLSRRIGKRRSSKKKIVGINISNSKYYIKIYYSGINSLPFRECIL